MIPLDFRHSHPLATNRWVKSNALECSSDWCACLDGRWSVIDFIYLAWLFVIFSAGIGWYGEVKANVKLIFESVIMILAGVLVMFVFKHVWQ